MSDDDQDQDQELKEEDDDELPELPEPEPARKSDSRKSGSVKFSDLNQADELEKQYEELMVHEPTVIENFDNDEDGPAPDLVDAAPPEPPEPEPVVEPEPEPVVEPEPEPEPTNPEPEAITLLEPEPEPTFPRSPNPSIVEPSTERTSVGGGVTPSNDPNEFSITPEDIFNQLKIAKGEIEDQDGSQTIHSFIISKSFSSENVVVLLNLRRMKDGEWVLDKTIAQGLKSETYGGVVSIDKYEFSDSSPPPATAAGSRSSQKSSTSAKGIPKASDDDANVSENNRDIMEILKKLQDQVNQVNQEIEEARKAAKNIPPCRPCSENANEEAEPENVSFENLSLLSKLKKLFDVMLSVDDEPCSCCTENVDELNVNTIISDWVDSTMTDMKGLNLSGYNPFAYFIPGAPGSMDAAEAAALISQSTALMQEAQKSGLMDKINPEASKTSTDRSSLSFGKADEDPFQSDEIQLQRANENTNVNESLQLHIESQADVDSFIKEHANNEEGME